MGFESKPRAPRMQVSTNSYGERAKEIAGNAAHAVGNAVKSTARTIKHEVSEAGSAIGSHAKDAAKTVAHHARSATPFHNTELKHRMQHKTGRAIDD